MQKIDERFEPDSLLWLEWRKEKNKEWKNNEKEFLVRLYMEVCGRMDDVIKEYEKNPKDTDRNIGYVGEMMVLDARARMLFEKISQAAGATLLNKNEVFANALRESGWPAEKAESQRVMRAPLTPLTEKQISALEDAFEEIRNSETNDFDLDEMEPGIPDEDEAECKSAIEEIGKRRLEEFPLQLLQMEEEDGLVSFTDPLQHEHKSAYGMPWGVNITALIKSCRLSHSDEVFTCTCGIPECAGIYKQYSVLDGNSVFVCVNDDTVFRFDKRQIEYECLKVVADILLEFETKDALWHFLSCSELKRGSALGILKWFCPDCDIEPVRKGMREFLAESLLRTTART